MVSPDQNNRDTTTPNIQPGAFQATLDHAGANELLHMNKWQFLLIIERLQKQRKGVQWEHVAIPFGLCIGTLFSTLPADFKDYLGIKGAVWESAAFMLLVLSAITTVVLILLCINNARCHKQQSPEEVYDNVLEQWEQEQEKLRLVEANRLGKDSKKRQ